MKERALQGWLKKLKDIAYDVDDVLDVISAKNFKVMNLFSISKHPIFCHKIAHRVKEIRERLNEIAEERSKFHLREGFVVNESEIESGDRESGSLIQETEVYGREKDKEMIVDSLLNMQSDYNPEVLAIVGLGGLGKTTLAQLVFNDKRVCEHFELKIWVCVSMKFDIKRIYRSIIESITGSEYKFSDMDMLQQTLTKNLGQKKFLLVLDDVWNENHENWERLRIALASGGKGSRVLVTTRSQRVAALMGSSDPCFLSGLSENDCWALFERSAFGVGGLKKTLNLEAIGMEIVKKCGGVPLGAKALGRMLHFVREESMWLAIKDSEIWKLSDDHDDEILPALKLSYDHLPSRLKQCFTYISIFPKAFEISKKTLVQLWIAEGFIRSFEGGNLEDMGFHFVDELLSRSLFQSCPTTMEKIKIHDLVHDLGQSIAGDECSIVDSSGRGLAQNSRYSSFICDGEVSSIQKALCQAKKLCTFHLISSEGILDTKAKARELLQNLFEISRSLRALHLHRFPIKSLPNSIKNLKHLRYLDLSRALIKTLPPCVCKLKHLEMLNLNKCECLESLPSAIGDLLSLLTLDLSNCSSLLSLPNSIGRLQNLRKLSLSCCQIQTLPESLTRLSKLQTLDLDNCYFLCELPKNMKDMRNLIHLCLYRCYRLTHMPAGVSHLSHLRTLSRFVLCEEGGCSIRELGGLNLEGLLEITGLENVSNAVEASEANLKEKPNIQKLLLCWNTSAYRQMIQAARQANEDSFVEALTVHWDSSSKASEDVLEALQPHASLKNLCISFFEGRTLPSWMMKLSLLGLSEVTLSSCIRCEHLPAFGRLPCLKVLTLTQVSAVKCLDLEFYGSDNAFPLLEELNLSEMLELEEWSAPVDGEIFPSLTKLSISECRKLKSLPSIFPYVRNLEMDVDDELMLSSMQNGAFPNLRHLSVGNFNDEDLPEVISDRMSSLMSWTVRRRPKPLASGSTSMSSSGFGFTTIYGGTNIIELPIW